VAQHRRFVDIEDPAYSVLYGGSGGFRFDDALLDADRVRSLWLASGSLIDSIQIIYRNGARTSRHGGLGGAGGWTAFEPDELILSVSGRVQNYLEQLVLRTTHRTISAGGRDSAGEPFTFSAPEGHHIIGFHGRCGRFVDAIGVRLAALPAPRHDPRDLARAELRRMPQVNFTPFVERRC
jgi:hypothetical protein